MLGILVLTATAHADGSASNGQETPSFAEGSGASAPESGGEATAPPEAPEVVRSAPAPTEAPTEVVRSAPVETPEVARSAPVPAETPEVVGAAPTPVEAPEVVRASPDPVEGSGVVPKEVPEVVASVPVVPVSPVVPVAPVVPVLDELIEAVPVTPVAKEVVEPVHVTPGSGETTEGSLSPLATTDNPPLGPQAGVTHNEAVQEVLPASGGIPPGASIVGSLAEPSLASGEGGVSGGTGSRRTAAQRAGALSCELSALGGGMTDNCSSGWLGAQRVLSASRVEFATAASSLAVVADSTPGGGHGGSAVGSPPVGPGPGPGPAPSGASGSAAGASGLALSGFLTLAGLLHLGAPRAMRRLRLSCQPQLTACFVLIPERPG